MSTVTVDNRQRCFNIIERFPKDRLGNLADSLESMFNMIEEAMDEAFCAAMSDRHASREDKNEPGIPLETFAAELGFTIEDLSDENLEN